MCAPGRWLSLACACAAAVALAPGAHAQGLSWHFDQIYSNADGNIQFVVIKEYANNQNQNSIAGAQFNSSGSPLSD